MTTSANRLLEWICAVSNFEAKIGPDPATMDSFKDYDPFEDALELSQAAEPDKEAVADTAFMSSAYASRQIRCNQLVAQGITDTSALAAALNCSTRHVSVLKCRARKHVQAAKKDARHAKREVRKPVKIAW